MARIRKNIFFAFRLAVTLLCLCGLSPDPDFFSKRTAPPVPANQTRIFIWKSRYLLAVYQGDKPLKSYRAVFGGGYQDGDKQAMGDRRTPEGEFYICTMNHSKRFYKFMGLSYPGLKHAAYGLERNIISPEEYTLIQKAITERQQPPWETSLGGAVGIHGRMLKNPEAARSSSQNWTDGCIALDNADVDEIYSMVSLGTPVTILP